jgi:hypothetical protein
MKILANAIAEILGLTDIDDLGFLVAKEITTGLGRKVGELFLEGHWNQVSKQPRSG